MISVSSNSVTPRAQVLSGTASFYFPFSIAESWDLFKTWSSKPSDNTIKILLLNSGDIRHALITAAGEKENNCLDIHLTENNPLTIARDVLILSIIDSQDFKLEGNEDLKFLWNVWYNAFWDGSTSARFIEKVKNLIGGALPSNVKVPRREDREALNDVWQRWLSMFDSNGKMSAEFIKEVTESRKKFIIRGGWKTLNGTDNLFGPSDPASLRNAAQSLANHVQVCVQLYEGMRPDDNTYEKLTQELIYYFERGYCFVGRQNSGTRNTSVNPTFLEPITKKWYVHYQLNPFEGFFSLFKQNILQADVGPSCANDHAILLRNSQAVLRMIIETYRYQSRRDSAAVKFTFHLSDPFEFCVSRSSGTFDVIDGSHLLGNEGLPNILLSARNRLSVKNPDAVIITKTFRPFPLPQSFAEHVQRALGVTLSMTPSVYGLKLTNTVELGAPKVMPLTAHLIWRRCPQYEDVVLPPSESLKNFFNHMFFVLNNSTTNTSLTFHLMVCGVIQQYGLPLDEVDTATGPLDPIPLISELWRLQLRTLDCWVNGRRLFKYKSIINDQNQINQVQNVFFKSNHGNSDGVRIPPVLKIILVPTVLASATQSGQEAEYNAYIGQFYSTNVNANTISGLGQHIIDVFTINLIRSEDDPERLKAMHVTFILPEDTTVEVTHTAVLVAISNFNIQLIMGIKPKMFYLGNIKSLTKESFNQPYPIQFERKSSKRERARNAKFKMIECLECEGSYVVKIIGGKQTALTFYTDQESPCESAHVLKISQKNAIQTFQFSHPFKANAIISTPHVVDGTLTVTLPKAIHEPWPFQFKNTKKIDTNFMKPWSETKLASMSMHVGAQFKMAEIKTFTLSPEIVKSTPLNEVRQVIQSVFSTSIQSPIDVVFALKDGRRESHSMWYLRAHCPIRVGPNGEPFLAITAFDHEMVTQLVKHSRMDVNNVSKDFSRIMLNDSRGHYYFTMPTPEGVQLFRYLLRLNSTKVEANAWQRRNLPEREKNDPLVMFATYLSPLYGDTEWPIDAASSACVTCGKRTDLKKCSRCKSVSYCGAVCQRKDWPRHKSNCHAGRLSTASS